MRSTKLYRLISSLTPWARAAESARRAENYFELAHDLGVSPIGAEEILVAATPTPWPRLHPTQGQYRSATEALIHRATQPHDREGRWIIPFEAMVENTYPVDRPSTSRENSD